MVLDQHQIKCVDFLKRRKRGCIFVPAGGGKTICAAAALHAVVFSKSRENKVKVGWIGNTNEQVQQAYRAMLQIFSGETVPPPEAEAIWNSKDRAVDFKAHCAAAQTNWADRDVLVVDEAHHCLAETWAAQIHSCSGARWGMTATPPEDPEPFAQMIQLLGEALTIDRSEIKNRLVNGRVMFLQDSDHHIKPLVDADIESRLADRLRRFNIWFPEEHQELWIRFCRSAHPSTASISQSAGKKSWILQAQAIIGGEATARLAQQVKKYAEEKAWGQCAWQSCIKIGIVGNRARTQAAINLAVRHQRDTVLMLVNEVEHAQVVSSAIPNSVACFSKMGAKKRREAMDSFRAGQTKCMVATSLADEGLDLPMANVLVLVSGGRSNAKTTQRVGRVLRTWGEKTHGLIYDFRDYWHPLAAKHARKREELYRSLGYEVLG